MKKNNWSNKDETFVFWAIFILVFLIFYFS